MPNYKRTILLTGAGFTKNFGGYLGREMWAKIFNHPALKDIPKVKKSLGSNFDFESVYANVLKDSDLTEQEKKDFQKIVLDAYDSMDRTLRQYRGSGEDPYQVNFHGVGQFLGLFAGTGNEMGLHFTLNQDLFLERMSHSIALGFGTLQYNDYRNAVFGSRLESSFRVDLPDQNFIDGFKKDHLNSWGNYGYIKLHGSSGWFAADGSNRMVLGNNKLHDIKKEPLLNWYLDIFEEVLNRPEVRLFILGYGFRDVHVNERIVNAIQKHGLRLYVISPTDPEVFKNTLIGKPTSSGQAWEPKQEGVAIWEAVVGYFPYSLKEIFPADQSETDKRDDLFKAILM